MYRPPYFLLYLWLGAALSGCSEARQPASRSFYHWKTALNLDAEDRQYLDSLSVRRLYLRLFDVKREGGQNRPVAMLHWQQADLSEGSEIVPTVFIANAVLVQTPEAEIDSLARQIGGKMRQIIDRQIDSLRHPVREAQFDCDWTLETRDKYFRLLRALRPFFGRLSATIRLHQIKFYAKTGVPPVDRGILMFYNMGSIDRESEPNSILNLKTAKEYLVRFEEYPLELDLALPLFRWGVQFRQGKIVQILSGLSADELRRDSLLRPIDESHFEVETSGYLGDNYVYRGDRIRTEAVRSEDLQAALNLLRPHFEGRRAVELIFYHLDETIRRQYPATELLNASRW